MSHPETWAKKKKQDPLGGTYVSPVTWAKKKQDPLGGTYVSPRDVGPTRGDVCPTQRRGQKKTRPARGDICLTQGCGQRNETHVGQYPVPSHWVMEERLIDAPPLIKGGTGAYPVPPQIRREGLIVAPPSHPLRGDIGAHPMSP